MTSSKEKTLRDQLNRAYTLNEYLKAHTTHWCPVVSSPEIRQLLVDRCTDLGVTMSEVVIRADVSWNTVKKYYLNCDEPESRPSLRMEDLMAIGLLLGIEIKATAIVGDIKKVDRTKLLNDKFIPRGKRKKNKKFG